MVMEEVTGAWGDVTVVRECESHQGGVKGIRKVCKLMEIVMGEM